MFGNYCIAVIPGYPYLPVSIDPLIIDVAFSSQGPAIKNVTLLRQAQHMN